MGTKRQPRLSSYTRSRKQLYFIRRATTFPQIVLASRADLGGPLNHRACTEAFRYSLRETGASKQQRANLVTR